ncbi:MAG: hypothetical protein UX17_C0029G0001 [Parcubacteria group bacterium GW2011_GWC2_45_7]|nr:MAG: hypothetical protein UX17_C0029G0001 [Parcubacteria group bacterium GW2011_GWC2_45_7]
MTIKELRQLNEVEQGKILQESRKKLRELRFKAARRDSDRLKIPYG